MKNVNVVAAVIKKGDLIFITQRGYGEFKDYREFPGGKVESNESKEDAIKREIKEELDASIKVEKYVGKVEYDYPTFHLNMDVFLASLIDEKLVLLEHENASWVHKDELDKYNFLPADIEVIEMLKSIL